MIDFEISCPICKKEEKPSTLLFDYNSELFEESYNWLNCPSLPPPEEKEEEEEEDVLLNEPIDYEELYFNADENIEEEEEEEIIYNHKSQDDNLSMIDKSLARSYQNHILEYQKWKETLHWNDKRVIWWVCNENPSHIWRESVKSRVTKCMLIMLR